MVRYTYQHSWSEDSPRTPLNLSVLAACVACKRVGPGLGRNRGPVRNFLDRLSVLLHCFSSPSTSHRQSRLSRAVDGDGPLIAVDRLLWCPTYNVGSHPGGGQTRSAVGGDTHQSLARRAVPAATASGETVTASPSDTSPPCARAADRPTGPLRAKHVRSSSGHETREGFFFLAFFFF